VVIWVLMWARWTFPRLRIDHILQLEWKYLMPLMLAHSCGDDRMRGSWTYSLINI
jgi:NADH:ubiquinone oxidoreductase subunit H